MLIGSSPSASSIAPTFARRCATACTSALLQLIAAFRAVASRRHPDAQILDESLIVVYRVLFLLFAEARGLVPSWHPVYREGYTIEARVSSSAVLAIRRASGKRCRRWPGSRTVGAGPARSGCRRSTAACSLLRMRRWPIPTARRSRRLRSARGPDDEEGEKRAGSHFVCRPRCGAARGRLRASARLRRRSNPARRNADARADRPPQGHRIVLHATTVDRVPRPPDAGSDRAERGIRRILGLRVLDPAMGSGAFLVAACRYLAAAYEQALVREGPRGGRHSRGGPRRVPPGRRAAVPVRGRRESDGGAAWPAVAVAGDTGGRQAAFLLRSPSANGQQPGWRVDRRHHATPRAGRRANHGRRAAAVRDRRLAVVARVRRLRRGRRSPERPTTPSSKSDGRSGRWRSCMYATDRSNAGGSPPTYGVPRGMGGASRSGPGRGP